MPILHRMGPNILVSKASAPDPQPLNAAEQRLFTVVRRALSSFNDEAFTNPLSTALSRGDVPGVLAALDLSWLIRRFAPVRKQIVAEISSGATEYAGKLGITGEFGVTDPHIIAEAERNTGILIKYVSDSTRDSVRKIVTSAIASQELTVDDVSKILRGIVGVTPQSAQAIANARARFLTDAAQNNVPRAVAERRADALVTRMRNRAIASRATTIARTEIMRANNSGRMLSWQAGARTGAVTAGHLKEWVTAPHGSRYGPPCPICSPLDGVKVPWDQDFPGGFPMPPAHPRCRCTATLRAPEVAEIDVDAWLEQMGA